MGLEAHACSLRVFVTLHVSGAVVYATSKIGYCLPAIEHRKIKLTVSVHLNIIYTYITPSL